MKQAPRQFSATVENVPWSGLGLRVILVPTDFSPSATLAFRYALSLAKETGGEVVLLNVVENPLAYSMAAQLGEDGLQDLSGDAQHKLDQLCQREAPGSDDVLTMVRLATEAVWKEIVLTAGNIGANLIVIPAHDGAGIRRFLFGDIIDKIVRHASCAVLMVPAFDAAPARNQAQAAKRP